jgi:ankyrin repeat protein
LIVLVYRASRAITNVLLLSVLSVLSVLLSPSSSSLLPLQTTVRDNRGRTLLHEAAGHGHIAALQSLQKLKELWHSEVDYAGATALHEAAANGHQKTVHQLLFTGVPPNVQDGEG